MKKASLGQTHRGGKVFVMMSGGVDSSVAAALLKERGFDVCGIHIKMWSDPSIPCTTKEDRYDAMRAAAHLGVPFETWDLTDEYKRAVVEYMIAEYAAGRTPNPDVMCNRDIKFGVFLERALATGADLVATGHYALKRECKMQHAKCKSYVLACARDSNKDQSYFLWTLTQRQLRYCLFPIGDYTKPEVREMARSLGLPNAEKRDSQGVCFIGEFDMRKYLSKYIIERRGSVVTTRGRVVGEHNGVQFYTIGQRHGLSIGGGIPYYIAEKQKETNTLVVAEGPYDERLFRDDASVISINWISGKAPKLPMRCMARIRYRQPLQEARIVEYELGSMGTRDVVSSVSIIHNSRFVIQFDEPQRAVTSGQSVVFYQGDIMLGGGVIE